ncbi:MAG: phosphoglycerate kinase [Peptococcaceae bacterium]|nr:phosphoglycerate kinase [Peptococcaceae bacterium]
MVKMTVRDVDPGGKKVLVRVDFNVPLQDGLVNDDTRIKASLPTIRYLLEKGAAVILASHLGRPKGRRDERYSLRPVVTTLAELLGREVTFAADCVGPQAQEQVAALRPGQVLLLENLRFHPEEEKNDEGFARQLATGAELYVNDAFGTAHRAHASTVGVTRFLPAAAGLLMEKELTVLGRLLVSPRTPFVAILGGAKVSDKIGVVENLLAKIATLVVGGGMANTMLAATGRSVGKSLREEGKEDLALAILNRARELGVAVLLPVDAVVAPALLATAPARTVPLQEVGDEDMILDIGPASRDRIARALKDAGTVFWNGPPGAFEVAPFAGGTMALARTVAGLSATTVVGGGDTVAAVRRAGVAGNITHISTGGGASLEFLEGRELPGVAALRDLTV